MMVDDVHVLEEEEVVLSLAPKERLESTASVDSLDNGEAVGMNGNKIKTDGNLSDEGLGDITSEASNSPQPPSSLTKNDNCNGNGNTNGNCDSQNNVSINDGRKKSSNLNVSSPCDERVPSRIPLLAEKAVTARPS